MKREKYSIVFRPTDEIVGFVAKLKSGLKQKTGWFRSVDSEAHITLLEFEADEAELAVAINFLERVCAGLCSAEVVFDHFGAYPTVLYVGVDTKSKIFLKSIMKKVAGYFPLAKQEVSNDPHMSIGRGLNKAKIDMGLELFEDVLLDFSFDCDGVFLRKFNGRQYDVVNRFRFGNAKNESPETGQLNLFE